MTDIFLYQGEPNPSDVKLSDPTVPRGGGNLVKIASETLRIVEEIISRGRSIKLANEMVLWIVTATGIFTKLAIRISDTLAIIEGIVRKTTTIGGAIIKIISETLNFPENLIWRLRSIRIVNETERFVEGLARIAQSIKMANETERFVEGIIRRSRSVLITNEIERIAESVVNRMRSVRIVSDTLRWSEVMVRKSFTQMVRIVGETLAIVEIPIRKTFTQIVKIIGEMVQYIEGIIRQRISIKIIIETEQFIEGAVRRLRAVKSVNEPFILAEGIARRLRTIKIINEPVLWLEGIIGGASALIRTFAREFLAMIQRLIFGAEAEENFTAILKPISFDCVNIYLEFNAMMKKSSFEAI